MCPSTGMYVIGVSIGGDAHNYVPCSLYVLEIFRGRKVSPFHCLLCRSSLKILFMNCIVAVMHMLMMHKTSFSSHFFLT